MAMNRLTFHHTGGRHTPNSVDLAAYHGVIDGEARVVPGLHKIEANAPGKSMRPGTYAAHTARLNTGNIGRAIACMAGGKWADPRASVAFPKPEQLDAMLDDGAGLCVAYGITPDRRFTLTHAEVEITLGIKQKNKWDFDYPFAFIKTATRDPVAIGDEMRQELARRIKNLPRGLMPFTPPAPPARPTLRQGATGDLVREVQRAVGVTVDGAFGPATRAAVAAYQRRNNLLPDGVVGDMTWDQILGVVR